MILSELNENAKMELFREITESLRNLSIEKMMEGGSPHHDERISKLRWLQRELLCSLPGRWIVQRHGGYKNHEWRGVGSLPEFKSAEIMYLEALKNAKRGKVRLVYLYVSERAEPSKMEIIDEMGAQST